MLHKLSKPILTERTIDTPYAQRSPHKQKTFLQTSGQNNSFSLHLQQKRKNFTQKQNSLSDPTKNFSISRQFNQNTINTSKNRSLPHQEQHSKNFNKKKPDKSFQSPNITLNLNNKSIPEKSFSQNKVIKRSLSKKTEKIKFNKKNIYLQQVKQRRILQDCETVQQMSLANLSQQFRPNEATHQPKLNVQVCLQYFNMNNSTSFAHFNRSQQVNLKRNSSQEFDKLKNRNKLFPKSQKYLDETIGRNSKQIHIDYFSNHLPVNADTIQLSKQYNFELKLKRHKKHQSSTNFANLSKPISISLKGGLSKKENNHSQIVPYLMKSTGFRESRSVMLKKTERVDFFNSRSAFLVPGVGAHEKRVKTQNNWQNAHAIDDQTENCVTIVENVPANIFIQQSDLEDVQIQGKQHGIQDYGMQLGPKAFGIKKYTKVFICKYCLEIFSIFQIRYHKGEVCNIAHKQTQFIDKIRKVYTFLNHTYESYYQMRPFYECFRDLAKMIEVKLQHLSNEQKFISLSSRIQAILSRKQNYHLHRVYKSAQRDRFLIQKVEELLHLEDFLESQKVFSAIYEMIDLGNNNSSQGPIHREKIIIVKHLFWLIRKLFEGLVLEKIKQMQM